LIRVLIADDNHVIRHGLSSLLRASDDIVVVAEAATGQQAIEAAREFKPDVVLLDVHMPVTDGVTAAATLSQMAKVMMLTYADDEETVTAAIKAGASGYVVHGRFGPDELEQAVRDLAAGLTVLSPAVAPVVFDALRREAGPVAAGLRHDGLTEQETRVMNLLAQGRSNREIATELYLSEKTVKNHINRIYAKLAVRTRPEAIAAWLGVVSSHPPPSL
jgi:DNA-binding NarL/FixJ family response regulator